MQPPSAAGIQLPTLLDLVGSSLAANSLPASESTFDTLLNPASSARPPAVIGSTGDDARLSSARQSPAASSSDASPPTPAAESASHGDETGSVAGADSSQSDTPQQTSRKKADAAEPSDATVASSEQVVVESLTGLTAAVAMANLPVASAAPAESATLDTPEIVSGEKTVVDAVSNRPSARISGAKPKSAGNPSSKTPQAQGDSQPTAETAALDHVTEVSDQQPASEESSPLEVAAKSHEAVGQEHKVVSLRDVRTDDGNELTPEAGQQVAAAAGSPQLDAASAPTDSKLDPQRDGKPSESASSSPAAAENAPLANSPSAPTLAPVVVAANAAAAPPDGPASAAKSAASTSVAPVATQRTRLPGEVLAPATRARPHSAAAEIDTVRLLSRVAKAFAAAQEREGEIRLRLSPPDLGSLRLEVRVQDGALVAHLQTETDAARAAIVDNLPVLRERLAEQGVRIERFDVDLMHRQPGGSPDQPGGRQQDPPALVRTLPPPKTKLEVAVATSSVSVSAAAGGLNVIV